MSNRRECVARSTPTNRIYAFKKCASIHSLRLAFIQSVKKLHFVGRDRVTVSAQIAVDP